jgi:hypothetical protein
MEESRFVSIIKNILLLVMLLTFGYGILLLSQIFLIHPMKHIFSVLAVMTFLISTPMVFAQSDISDTRVEVRLPAQFMIGDEVPVSIDVTKGDGLPWDGDLPSVTFTPTAGVEEDVVYDCSNVDESDSCQANNRGVAGVYESVFILRKTPLTMTVDIDGVSKQVQLMATNAEQPVTESVEERVSATPATVSEPVTAASLQVGPSPSMWIILIPLAFMGLVLTFFVVKT